MPTLEQRLVYNSGFVACFEPILIWLKMYQAALTPEAPEAHQEALAALERQLTATRSTLASIPAAFPRATLRKSFFRAQRALQTTRRQLMFVHDLPHPDLDGKARAVLRTLADDLSRGHRGLVGISKRLPASTLLWAKPQASAGGPAPHEPHTKAQSDADDLTGIIQSWWRDPTTDLLELAESANNAMDEMDWVEHHVKELQQMVACAPKTFTRAQREVIGRAVQQVERCEQLLLVARDLYPAPHNPD